MRGGERARQSLRRNIPRFDQPLSWSVPIARGGRRVVRAHVTLLATVVVVMIRAAWHVGDSAFALGPWLAAIALLAMLIVVLVHELATMLVSMASSLRFNLATSAAWVALNASMRCRARSANRKRRERWALLCG